MDATNVVLLRGTVKNEPVVRELPSGTSVTQLEVTTRLDGRAVTVPVVVHDEPVTCCDGDAVVVTGHVHRRFFRAGGVTQSRTEVVASRLLRAGSRRSVARAVAEVVGALDADADVGPGRRRAQ